MTAVAALLDEIRTESRELDPMRVLLTLLAAVPFVVFWAAGKLCRGVFFVGAWVWTAGLVGWRHAYGEGHRS